MATEIDYVIAWVDGQDPQHMAARQAYQNGPQKVHAEARSVERYQDNGEIYYHLASIIRYAPFIRRVLIVADQQRPRFLDDFLAFNHLNADFIRMVSHDEIFEGLGAVRPSFNARAIESALWRIKDLSEHFVFANDDFFINGEIDESYFFKNGLPVIYDQWAVPEDWRWKYRLRQWLARITSYRYNRPNHGLSQWKAAQYAGVEGRYLSPHHYPHPLRRSTLENFFLKHPDLLRKQLAYRFRHIEQFNMVTLANNIEVFQNKVVPVVPQGLAYIDHVKPKRVIDALRQIETASVPFGCVQGFEQFNCSTRHQIHSILIHKFAGFLPPCIVSALQNCG